MANKGAMVLAQIDVKQGEDGEIKFYIETKLKNDGNEGFKLTLTDGATAWEGKVSEDDLDQLSTKRKMDFNTYTEQTKAAFTRTDMADLSFEYHIKETGEGEAQFVWKKHIIDDDIKFQMGSVKLKKCGDPAQKLCQILSGCVNRTHQLQAQIKTLQADNERLSSDRQNALKRLDKCVTAKETLEKDLYSKFAAVLNSKKERIRQLEEDGVVLGSEAVDAADQPSPVESVESGKDRDAVAKRRRRDSEEVDTDEEISPKSKRTSRAATQKSVPKLSAESSLNLGEDEDMETETRKAPVARRPRRQEASKKETPVKPILPRVSSGNSASRPGSARMTSLRKSGSDNSNKSSDNLDPDDLLDNM